MARVSTYLTFDGTTEEAFTHYREVFGTEYAVPVTRMREMPGDPQGPPLSPAEQDLVAHVALPIVGGHVLMGTDVLPSRGHELRVGTNITVHLEFDDHAEAERVFAALSEGGSDVFGLEAMPWGAAWGTCQDRFLIRWMVSAPLPG